MRSVVSLGCVGVLVLTSLVGPAAAVSGPSMVKDIRQNGGSNPQRLTDVGGTLFFVAQTGTHGRELWMSDGTGPGTRLVKNIRPGSASSNPEWLTNINGTLYFTADDGSHGRELWISDGTNSGTRMVEDINTGGSSVPQSLTALGSKLFFSADDGSSGRELWKSKGTTSNTKRVKDILAGPQESVPETEEPFAAVGGFLYFPAYESPPQGLAHDVDLWKTSGSTVSTVRVEDLALGGPGAGAQELTGVGSDLFFEAGGRLWISDGSAAGTHQVVTGSNPKPGGPFELTDVAGMLFFDANTPQSLGGGEGLWTSDGTIPGTDFVADPSGSAQIYPSHLTAVGSVLFFDLINGFTTDLWTSDGTEPGTVFLQADVNLFANALVGGGILYPHEGELWRSDGSTTTMLADIPDNLGPLPEMLNVGGTVFFNADDGTHGYELWSYVP